MSKVIWFVKGVNRGFIEMLQSNKDMQIDINAIKGDTIGFFTTEKLAIKAIEELDGKSTRYPYFVAFPMESQMYPTCIEFEAERWFKLVRVDEKTRKYKEMERIEHETVVLK